MLNRLGVDNECDRQQDRLKPYNADRLISIKYGERRLTFYIAQVPLDNALVLGNLCEYCHNDTSLKTRFFGLHFCRRLYRSIFNHFDVIGP